jgi:hypothetical protein
MKVSFRCGTCDSDLEWPDGAIDSTVVACKNCGEVIGTYRDLRDQAEAAAAAEVVAILEGKRRL